MTENATTHQEQGEPKTEIVDATRHIGRTLEQEGIFADVMGDALPAGEPSPARINPEQSGVDEVDIRTFGDDRAYQATTQSEDAARTLNWNQDTSPVPGDADDQRAQTWSARLDNVPEPLHTHLAGDTSSDPHTDVGPDNATVLQKR